MISAAAEGMLRLCCWGRRLSGHRALVGLISGAAISLLVLALTPHPAPFAPPNPKHALRRIHQEDDDYTAPKPPAGAPQAPPQAAPNGGLGDTSGSAKEMAGPFNLPILEHPPNTKVSGQGHADKVQQGSQGHHPLSKPPARMTSPHKPPHEDPVERYAQQQIADVPREKTSAAEHVMKAQETALSALQHGYKLTSGQKRLIDRMSPKEKKDMEQRVVKLRAMQERAYLQQLRGKNQIVKRPDGGEMVISSPVRAVRLPTVLKSAQPDKWADQFKIFLNLTHYPWPNNPRCSNFSNTFRPPGSLPTRALGSFPSSGNTWIRYLIEGATGIFTGSLYDDSSLTRRGMYGEGVLYNTGLTILQKSHGYTTGDAMKLSHEERLTRNHMDELSHQGVLVIRNPFKALISHRHLDVGGHTGYAPKAHFIGKGWAEFVTLKIGLWKDFYIDWMTHSNPQDIHILHYEILKKDPVQAMKDVLQYLNLPIDEARMKCLGLHTDGLFKRKPSKTFNFDVDPYTSELKLLIYEAIDQVDTVLKEKGKPPLPLSDYEIYDSHEAHTAQYIRTQVQD